MLCKGSFLTSHLSWHPCPLHCDLRLSVQCGPSPVPVHIYKPLATRLVFSTQAAWPMLGNRPAHVLPPFRLITDPFCSVNLGQTPGPLPSFSPSYPTCPGGQTSHNAQLNDQSSSLNCGSKTCAMFPQETWWH